MGVREEDPNIERKRKREHVWKSKRVSKENLNAEGAGKKKERRK